MGSYTTYSALCFENRPAFQGLLDVPEGQVDNGDLPERNEVQVSILLLSGGGLFIVLNRLGWLATNEAHSTLSK